MPPRVISIMQVRSSEHSRSSITSCDSTYFLPPFSTNIPQSPFLFLYFSPSFLSFSLTPHRFPFPNSINIPTPTFFPYIAHGCTAKMPQQQGLLKRNPKMTREQFSEAWLRHGAIVTPYFLSYGFEYYAQVPYPPLTHPSNISSFHFP